MKRIIVLFGAALFICLSLSACMGSSANTVKEKASEAVSDLKQKMTEYSNDNNGLLDDNRATENLADPTAADTGETYDLGDAVATEWDDMVENGEVDDGDGNVGDRENDDGDGNIDPDAVD